jgi:hypothetical protein
MVLSPLADPTDSTTVFLSFAQQPFALTGRAIKLSVQRSGSVHGIRGAKQRSILRTQKFPSKQENVAIIVNYGEARRAIEASHEADSDPATLVSAVDTLSA